MDLVLVVPCYNEAERLPERTFLEFLASTRDATIVFVDDGSHDGTPEVLARIVAAQPGRAKLVRLDRNRGKGEAVRAGLLTALNARPILVGYWDADLATPLDTVHEFRAMLAARPDLDWVIGSRVKLLGRRIERRATRHYVGRVFATAASLLLAIPVYDTQCGAKLFRVNAALEDSLAEAFVSRWIFDVELMGRYLNRLRARGSTSPEERIFELPLPVWIDQGESKVRLLDFLTAPWELLRIRRALRRR